MSRPLMLFVGPSGSGKSTVANLVESKCGYRQVWSYTTRPKRYEDEEYHIFISDKEFDNLGELVAYTEYNGYRYGTTFTQLEECDTYVIDVQGIETLLQKQNFTSPIRIIYFDTTVYTRINRMIDRGDHDNAIVARLLQDEEYDWLHKLNSLVWHYSNLENKDVEIYVVNANNDVDQVFKDVESYIKQSMEV